MRQNTVVALRKSVISQREALIKLLLPFQEELALFRQRQLEACQVHLFLVGLNGCEIRIERPVHRVVGVSA
jgi:hypothetical protein